MGVKMSKPRTLPPGLGEYLLLVLPSPRDLAKVNAWKLFESCFIYPFSQDAIAAALVGNSLLKAMQEHTEDSELVNTIQELTE